MAKEQANFMNPKNGKEHPQVTSSIKMTMKAKTSTSLSSPIFNSRKFEKDQALLTHLKMPQKVRKEVSSKPNLNPKLSLKSPKILLGKSLMESQRKLGQKDYHKDYQPVGN